MQERREEGKKGCRIGGIQGRWDAEQEGFKTGGITRKEGNSKGGIHVCKDS